MRPTILDDIENASSRQKIRLKCQCCESIFLKPKNKILAMLKSIETFGKPKLYDYRYCGIQCRNIKDGKVFVLQCKNCGKQVNQTRSHQKKHKNVFCSSSCAATYNNTHKTHGYRRSRLEIWLETELTKLYPNLEVHYCRKDAINGELDIYIPSLKLAFELNGIFHYEPIYGQGQLDKIQNNDKRKFQACIERGIELCIIDSSSLKHFKPDRAIKYLEIIQSVLDRKMVSPAVLETACVN